MSAILKLAVNPNNPELLALYKTHVEKHNDGILKDPFPNSGFDVFVPQMVVFDKEMASQFIDMEIKCEMVYGDSTCAFNVHPRSSISKTQLMLANHTGIIDSGYRGNLIGAFRWLKHDGTSQYIVEKHTRLLQICHPSLCGIHVKLVDESELSNTSRGSGGFGSTGL